MMVRRRLWIGLVVLVAVGCGGGMSKTAKRVYDTPIVIHANVSDEADFRNYNTWSWMPGLGDRFPESLISQESLSDLAEAFKSAMFERGYQQASLQGDLMVNAHLAVDDVNQEYVEDFYDGTYYPEYRPEVEGGKQPKKWEEGTLVVFIFDATTGQMVFQGTAQTEVTGEMPVKEREERAARAMTLLMEKMPSRQ